MEGWLRSLLITVTTGRIGQWWTIIGPVIRRRRRRRRRHFLKLRYFNSTLRHVKAFPRTIQSPHTPIYPLVSLRNSLFPFPNTSTRTTPTTRPLAACTSPPMTWHTYSQCFARHMRPNLRTKSRTNSVCWSMIVNHLPNKAACFPRRARTF
jgi:hypothetical protein